MSTDAGRPRYQRAAERAAFAARFSDAIYRAWQKDRFDLVTLITQIDELRRASRYAKFKDVLQPYRVGTMVNSMRRSIVLNVLPPLPAGVEAADLNDTFLLAMVLAGEADYLVTGDHRAGLLQRGNLGRTRIITPVTFCAEAVHQAGKKPF